MSLPEGLDGLTACVTTVVEYLGCSKTLARQFGAAFRTACAPFQYALSTRAGSGAVVRAVQTAIEADPE